MTAPRIVDLTITQLSSDGEGIAHYGEAIVPIPYTIPGDQVRVSLFRKRHGRYANRLVELLVPSPERISPRCVHFGQCGGCRLQQITYEQQLRYKMERLQKLFQPWLDTATLLPIIPCTPPWHYRNKMEFTFGSYQRTENRLGLNRANSRGWIIPLTECHLTPSWFQEVLEATRQWQEESALTSYHPPSDTGILRTLTLRHTSTGKMAFLTVATALSETHLQSWKEALLPIDPAISLLVRQQIAIKGSPTRFEEQLLSGSHYLQECLSTPDGPSLHFRISPSSFFQPNTRQAEVLYGRALQMAAIQNHECVYDLYCGTGTLGMFAAHAAKQVVGIEINPDAIANAQCNLTDNQITNVTLFQGDVGEMLQEKNSTLPSPDLIMVDPPRSGLSDQALEQILALAPKRLIYISCNPQTQAQNIMTLTRQRYALTELQPVDQFPHTPHLETIALLIKRD